MRPGVTKIYDIPREGCSSWQLVKAILLLGIPLIVSELGSIAQQFADSMMVGHFGTNELAAAGFVNTIFYFVIFLSLGIAYASTPLVGTAYGSKDYKNVFHIFGESLIVNLITGIFFVILMILVNFNMESLFFDKNSEYFHQPLEILQLSKQYLTMLTLSIPFLTLFYACKQYLDGIGNTRISMWILLFSNVVNIFLNWVLIFGKFGFPAMGLQGAGLSTLIARILQLILVIVAISKDETIKRHINQLWRSELRPTWEGIRKQFSLGLPISIQLGLEIGVFNVCGIFMGWLGVLPLAAHQAMYTISTLCFQVLYGIGAAATILISQFLGTGRRKNIRKVASTAFKVGLVSVGILSLAIYLFFEPLASFFTDDRGVVDLMRLILPGLLLYQVGDCAQIIYSNALRGLEDTKPLIYIAAFSYICVCIPLCYTFGFTMGYGTAGVWMGVPFGLTLAGILFYWRFHSKTRKFYR